MTRRVTMATMAAGLLLSVGCCWNRCGGGGLFTSRHRESAPCYLTGRGPELGSDLGPGAPLTAPPPGGVYVPGAIPGGPPNELPMPQPSNLIPAPNVPLAVPGVAPDPSVIGGVRSGQPIRTGR